MSDYTDAIQKLADAASSLGDAADRADNTTDFFDELTTSDNTTDVTNPNNSETVPSVKKQIQTLWDDNATDIQEAEASALAAVKYDDWSSLTGAQNKGVTVRDNNQVWILLADTTDITAIEPSHDDTTNWLCIDSDLVRIARANNTTLSDVAYLANGVTLSGQHYLYDVTNQVTYYLATDLSSAITFTISGNYAVINDGTNDYYALAASALVPNFSCVYAEYFGYGNSNVEPGAAMNAALDYAEENGIPEVRFFSAATGQTTPCYARSLIAVIGPEIADLASLEVADDTLIDAQWTVKNFDDLYTNPQPFQADGVTVKFKLKNIRLKGNKTAYTGTLSDPTKGMGFRFYSPSASMDNCQSINTVGIGWYNYYDNASTSDAGNTSGTYDGVSGEFTNVKCSSGGQESIVFLGPQDVQMDNIIGGRSGNTYQIKTGSETWTNKQSLLFTSGPIVAITNVTNTGLTASTAFVVSASDANNTTSDPEIYLYSDGDGGVDRVEIAYGGSNFTRDNTTLTITDNSSTVTLDCDLQVLDTIDDVVLGSDAVNINRLTTFENVVGWGVTIRNFSTNFPRVRGTQWMIGEARGGLYIGFSADVNINGLDIHDKGQYGSAGANIYPEIIMESRRQARISNITIYKQNDYTPSLSQPTIRLGGQSDSANTGVSRNIVDGVTVEGRGHPDGFLQITGYNAVAKNAVATSLDGAYVDISSYARYWDISGKAMYCGTPAIQGHGSRIYGSSFNVNIVTSGNGYEQVDGYNSVSITQFANWNIQVLSTADSEIYASKYVSTFTIDTSVSGSGTVTANHQFVRIPRVGSAGINEVRVIPVNTDTSAVVNNIYASSADETTITFTYNVATAGSSTSRYYFYIG